MKKQKIINIVLYTIEAITIILAGYAIYFAPCADTKDLCGMSGALTLLMAIIIISMILAFGIIYNLTYYIASKRHKNPHQSRYSIDSILFLIFLPIIEAFIIFYIGSFFGIQ